MKKMRQQQKEWKKRKNEATRTALSNLPNEIKDKIFLSLPMRNLFEFRYVIRDYTRFHNPHFIKMHLNRLMEIDNSSTFIITAASKIYKFDLEAYADPVELNISFRNPTCTTPIVVAASCNGLLCLTHRFMYGNIVYLWNPFTGEYKQLPPQNLRPRCIFSLGLGYDSMSGKFKVIAVAKLRDRKTKRGYKVLAFVYTLGLSSWRSIGEIRCLPYSPRWSRSQVFEGCPHWIDYDLRAVVSFNIGDEEFKEIPMPPVENRYGPYRGGWDERTPDLNAFGGRLSIFNYASELKRYELWVWMDDGFQSTWIRQVCFSELGTNIGGYGYITKLWGFRNGQVLLEADRHYRKYKVPILFDTEANDFISLYRDLGCGSKDFDVYSYVQSLAMLVIEDGDDVHHNS